MNNHIIKGECLFIWGTSHLAFIRGAQLAPHLVEGQMVYSLNMCASKITFAQLVISNDHNVIMST
jgi:hypothetical protein